MTLPAQFARNVNRENREAVPEVLVFGAHSNDLPAIAPLSDASSPFSGHPGIRSNMAIELVNLSTALAGAVERAAESVVAVHARPRLGTSGIVWRPNLILTSSEGIRSEDDIRVLLPDGRVAEARLRGRDPSTDLALLEAWENDLSFHSEYNNFGLHRAGTLEKRFAEDGLLSSRYGQLLVVASNDEVIGRVDYHQVKYGPNEGSTAYNIGIVIAAEHRGKGYGADAQRLLAAYLFDTYPIARVEALTDCENVPEQRALERAGFTREGVVRQAQWRVGTWHDLVMYSKVRGE